MTMTPPPRPGLAPRRRQRGAGGAEPVALPPHGRCPAPNTHRHAGQA
ncbi:hypothetical protein [Actinoplanes sp. L3-i22]|nr:hypothetical protein [Actinoplanes sp. L3-i22]